MTVADAQPASILSLPLLLMIIGWFAKRQLDKIEATISKNSEQIADVVKKMAENALDLRERFHDIRNVISEVKATVLSECIDIEKLFEINQAKIEAHHLANQQSIFNYKEDIVKTNQSINSIVRGNMEILQELRKDGEKIIRLEDYIKGLKTRMETIERNVMNPRPPRDI